jgi:hypothetical protein
LAIDWYFPRPELAKSYLEEFSRRGARALTVFAERGLGKTAFLQRDLTPEAVARGRLPVYVDVWAVRTDPAAGISGQLKAATQRLEHKDPSKREVTNFSVNVLGVGGGVTTAHRPEPGEPTNELSRINFWSDRLAQLAGEKTILLMLDEVQELAIHPDGASVAAALRASMQRNYGRFEPVFTGSQRDKLLQMFALSKAPLFEFGDDIDFPPLTRAFSAFVADHLKQEGGIELDVNQLHAAFVALGCKPGSLISLVRWMLRARTYDITAALAGALARERDEHERALSIAKLGPLDQIVLAAVAHERSVFSRSALEQYARHLGVEKVTAKAVQGALARLRDEQLIYQAARGTYRVNNSVLAGQLRESTPQMTDPKAVALPPLALGAALRPVAATPGHSYVGHVLEVTDQMVVQNSGGTFIRHDLANLIAGKYELLKPGTSVKIEYTDVLWKVAAAPGSEGT